VTAGSTGLRAPAASVRRQSRGRRLALTRQDRVAYSFLLPFLVLFTAVTLYPFLSGFFLSFTDMSPLAPESHWVGLDNYSTLLVGDPVFRNSIGNTVLYVVLLVPAQAVVGLLLALYVNKKLWAHQVSRLAFFAPFVLSVSVVGIVWGWILETRYGLLNLGLGAAHLPASTPWLTNVNWVMGAMVIASLWWHIGFSMVLFLAGLQDIPHELREVAQIDGASAWQSLWYVTLPLLRPVTSLVVVLGVIDAIKVFGLPWFMTNGGPAGASTTVVYDLYLNFQSLHMGYASAIGFCLLIIMLALALVRRVFPNNQGT
jgi:multiple sugar transport system permease protein